MIPNEESLIENKSEESFLLDDEDNEIDDEILALDPLYREINKSFDAVKRSFNYRNILSQADNESEKKKEAKLDKQSS